MFNASFAIILMGKRELVALPHLSSWCLVVWFFLAVPRVCLQFAIVVYPDNTHYFRIANVTLQSNVNSTLESKAKVYMNST